MATMTFSERIEWNPVDKHLLQLSGFPITELYRLDYGFDNSQSALYAHVCSLTTELKPGQDDFIEILLPQAKLEDLCQQIDNLFPDTPPEARQALWIFIAKYLWDDCYNLYCTNLNARRFSDPDLGNLFRALDNGIKRGMFGNQDILE